MHAMRKMRAIHPRVTWWDVEMDKDDDKRQEKQKTRRSKKPFDFQPGLDIFDPCSGTVVTKAETKQKEDIKSTKGGGDAGGSGYELVMTSLNGRMQPAAKHSWRPL